MELRVAVLRTERFGMVVVEVRTAVGLGTVETGGAGSGGESKQFGTLISEMLTVTVRIGTVGKGGAQAWDRRERWFWSWEWRFWGSERLGIAISR